MTKYQLIKDKKLEEIETIANIVLLFCNDEIIYTKDNQTFTKSDISDYAKLLDSNQSSAIIAKGLTINDHSFAIHRFFDDMIVGRRGDESNGEGFSVIKTKCNDNDTIYMLTTYNLPILSARISPLMQSYCNLYKSNVVQI